MAMDDLPAGLVAALCTQQMAMASRLLLPPISVLNLMTALIWR